MYSHLITKTVGVTQKAVFIFSKTSESLVWMRIARKCITAILLFAALESKIAFSQEQNAAIQEAFSIQQRGTELFRQGEYAKALPQFNQALAKIEKTLGKKHLATAATLYQLASTHYLMGHDDEALPLFERSLAIYENASGSERKEIISLVAALTQIYQKKRNYAKVIPLLEREVAINEKTKGSAHPDTAKALNELGLAYDRMGQYEKATVVLERFLRINEATYGSHDINTALALNNLAMIYDHAGQYERALSLYDRSLSIAEMILGSEHRDTATTLNNLGLVCNASGNYVKALRYLERSLLITQKILGPEHPDTANSLNNVALVYQSMGNYAEALPLFKRSLLIYEKAFGSESRETLSAVNNLAGNYQSTGNYTKALQLFTRNLALREKRLGKQHPDTAVALNNLASAYEAMGDYKKAQEFFEKALKIRKSVLGEEHPDTAQSFANLAGINATMGLYSKSFGLFERSLAIREKVLGPDHPDTAILLGNLALLHQSLGDNPKALTLLERALAIDEKSLGAMHPETATTLSNLAFVYSSIGDYSKALPLLKRSLAITEAAFGPDHTSVSPPLNNLASIYQTLGDYKKALPLFERGLAINEKSLGPENPHTATYLYNVAHVYYYILDYSKALPLLERSLTIQEKALGLQHHDTVLTLDKIALISYITDDFNRSREYSDKALHATNQGLQSILSMDERIRLSWQAKNASLGIAPCVLSPQQLANILLQRKGIVLDSISEDRAVAKSVGAAGQGEKFLHELASLRSRISKFAFSEKASEREEADRLESEVSKIERELAKFSRAAGRTRRSSQLTVENISSAMAPGMVLLDFMQFEDPKLPKGDQKCYGVVLTSPQGETKFVRIEGASIIDRALNLQRAAIASGDAGSFEINLKVLTEKLWAPIAKELPSDAAKLVISPDGRLNFLSFATLVNSSGQFLSEKYDIAYVGSARDLARPTKKERAKCLAIYANPVFVLEGTNSTPKTEMVTMRSAEASTFGEIHLPPLPGTEAESKELKKMAELAGWSPSVFTGKAADEMTLRNTRNPTVLHLATHGFYLNSFIPTGEGTRGMSIMGIQQPSESDTKNGVDPMRASGIALTGAQTTLNAWSQKKAPDPENDGVLTAEEVASLDLDGTWLVVLSACETGIGESRSGEGVLGLRRAFMVAGTENLLMTLWPVVDEATMKFMADFYKRALATGDAPCALAETQRDWLVKLRNEKGVFAAVREAGPFAMVMMANPNATPPLAADRPSR